MKVSMIQIFQGPTHWFVCSGFTFSNIKDHIAFSRGLNDYFYSTATPECHIPNMRHDTPGPHITHSQGQPVVIPDSDSELFIQTILQ